MNAINRLTGFPLPSSFTLPKTFKQMMGGEVLKNDPGSAINFKSGNSLKYDFNDAFITSAESFSSDKCLE